jgi:hypothetical protein
MMPSLVSNLDLPAHPQYSAHSLKNWECQVKPQKKSLAGLVLVYQRQAISAVRVSGAILVIGLKYGKEYSGDDAATEKTRALVRQFIQEFTEGNGSINCTELLGYNLNNSEEYKKAREERFFLQNARY